MRKTAIAFYFASLILLSLPGVASLQTGWAGNWYVGISGGFANLYGDLNTTMDYTGGAIPGSFYKPEWPRIMPILDL